MESATSLISTTTLAEALDAHRPELAKHCHRILGSAADADDAVQETIIRAWRHYDRFEHRSSVRTWLYRIATNVCVDQVRSRSRRPAPVDVEAEAAAAPPASVAAAPSPEPDEAAMAADDLRAALLAAITHLPARQRAVFVLHDVFRWPAHDVAGLLGTSTAAVASAAQRARGTLAGLRDTAGGRHALTGGQARLLRGYVDAFARYDLGALATMELDGGR
jgi:RNA polymerase sigma-70 factor (ECF subfamily)